jgi:hypothetical protein
VKVTTAAMREVAMRSDLVGFMGSIDRWLVVSVKLLRTRDLELVGTQGKAAHSARTPRPRGVFEMPVRSPVCRSLGLCTLRLAGTLALPVGWSGISCGNESGWTSLSMSLSMKSLVEKAWLSVHFRRRRGGSTFLDQNKPSLCPL